MRIKKRRCSRRPPQTMSFSRALYYNHKSRPMTLTAQFLKTCRRHQFHAQTPKKAPHKAKLYIIRTKKAQKWRISTIFYSFPFLTDPHWPGPIQIPTPRPIRQPNPAKQYLKYIFTNYLERFVIFLIFFKCWFADFAIFLISLSNALGAFGSYFTGSTSEQQFGHFDAWELMVDLQYGHTRV